MIYTKMHGLGNDFIVFYDEQGHDKDYTELTIKLCDRHTGIGGDGLIVATPSKIADICMRIINADGSEAEMCGNGLRCFADYVYRHGHVNKKIFTVETLAGIMTPEIVESHERGALVKVDMGKPSFTAKDIPMAVDLDKVIDYEIETLGNKYVLSAVLMGVPHAVVYVDNFDFDIATIGPVIEKHDLFPRNINVNFVQVIDKQHIKVRTWERGAGATLACGTGSCASVLLSQEKGLTQGETTVELALGNLYISYEQDGRVYMTGPSEEVFKTELA